MFGAAIAAADPSAATTRALSGIAAYRPTVRVLSVGKAARPMARGAVGALAHREIQPELVLVVSPAPADELAGATVIAGDHPIPGHRSLDAAGAVGRFVSAVGEGDDVLVLVSGGTTSLIAAPVEDVGFDDLVTLFRGLLASGADIRTMNALRKRVLRWGAGRLAKALYPARVRCLVASDVIGNDLYAIGSGPCIGDPLTALDVLAMMPARELRARVPEPMLAYLHDVAAGRRGETPRPDDPALANVESRIILDASDAISGAEAFARANGFHVKRLDAPPAGAAGETGARIARQLIGERRATAAPMAYLWSGETTVRLGDVAPAGGRCQELALECARHLDGAGADASGITVLAAGTDGHDGPTDAAGAVVDAQTWRQIGAAGRNAGDDLARHASYDALDVVGALFRTGPTGTNVNDLVLALVEPRRA
jgi:hydroxypyruvate reductase